MNKIMLLFVFSLVISACTVQHSSPIPGTGEKTSSLYKKGDKEVIEGEPAEGKKYYLKGIQESESLDHLENIVIGLNKLGYAEILLGDLDSALATLETAKERAAFYKFNQQMSDSLDLIGRVYFLDKDYEKSLTYHQKAYKADQDIQNRKKYGVRLNNIGLAQLKLGNLQTAIQLLEEARTYNQQYGLPLELGITLNNLGKAYLINENLEKAENRYKEGLLINKKQEYRKGIADCLEGLGKIEKKKGSTTSSIDFFTRALAVNQNIGRQKHSIVNLEDLIDIFEHTGESELIKKYQDRLESLRNKR